MAKNQINKELESIKEERDYLKELLMKVIENQKNSRVMDWVNVFCWITCFSLLIIDALKAK